MCRQVSWLGLSSRTTHSQSVWVWALREAQVRARVSGGVLYVGVTTEITQVAIPLAHRFLNLP